MKKLLLTATCLIAPLPAFAQDPIAIKPLIDARLRWEDVDQAGKPNKADAVTARVRAGFEAQLLAKFSLLAEATGTLAIDNDYFNNTPKSGGVSALFPTIADPQTLGLNRLHRRRGQEVTKCIDGCVPCSRVIARQL